MKLYFLYLSALTVGALCKIDDVCLAKSGKKGVLGKCQKKSECMKAGLAAFSKSGRTGVSGTLEELACSGDDAEVQCCVEIKCGSHNCRNNVESNSCAEGAYVANFRDRTLCPSSSPKDNVQCCVENSHNGLKRRQDSADFQVGDGDSPGQNSNGASRLAGLRMASAQGIWTTTDNNNGAPSVSTGITAFGGSVPTAPDAVVGSASVDTPVSAVANPAVDTLGAIPAPADTNPVVTPATSNNDIVAVVSTPGGPSNFNLAQIDDYSQSARGMTPASTANEGVSFGLNQGLRPQVTYNNGGGSAFSIGTTTPVTSLFENPGSALAGFQGSFKMGFRKLKRSLADSFH